MNLIVNCIWGTKLFENNAMEPYLKSLDKIDNAQKALLVTRCNPLDLEKISHHYDVIIEFSKDIIHCDYVIFDFISAHSDVFENVLFCDTRDVILQKNPFDYMNTSDKKLFLVSEGMNITESAPNYNWLIRLLKTQRDFNDDMFLNQVVNGGVFGGKIEHVIYLLMLAFTNTNRNSSEPIFNQTVYSFIEYYLKTTKFTEICKPDTSLFCLTGEGVGKHGVPMKIVDGLACNENSEPYYIFHQWDRTHFADEVINKKQKEGF